MKSFICILAFFVATCSGGLVGLGPVDGYPGAQIVNYGGLGGYGGYGGNLVGTYGGGAVYGGLAYGPQLQIVKVLHQHPQPVYVKTVKVIQQLPAPQDVKTIQVVYPQHIPHEVKTIHVIHQQPHQDFKTVKVTH